jgi:hypothetical protein
MARRRAFSAPKPNSASAALTRTSAAMTAGASGSYPSAAMAARSTVVRAGSDAASGLYGSMMAKMQNPTPDQLRKHLAYEVHYLVLAAARFRQIDGRDVAFYQDSALMHARNLLEFTKPGPKPANGWWVVSVGGQMPQANTTHSDWVEFINSNVSHLGERRLRDLQWPVPKDEERLTHIAKFVLERLKSVSQGSDPRAVVIHTLSQRGLRYLDDPTEENLAKIARAIDGPL